MEATSLVVAFSDSPALRETLSVLLEHDCQLRFLSADTSVPPDMLSADLALVATPGPTRLLLELRRRWPALPVVAVDVGADDAPHPSPMAQPAIDLVPLEPHAIRSAVLRELRRQPPTSLHATLRLLVETLRAELLYSFSALRSFAALHASASGPETYAILGAIMREQSYVLAEIVGCLHRFRDRPRGVDTSAHFVSALCRQLEQPDTLAAERGMLCECRVEPTATQHAGPLSLISTVAGLLRSHLRRRSDSPVIRVRASADGVVLSYPPRSAVQPSVGSWPLLLASLALQPWSWSVVTTRQPHEEAVSLQPGR